MALDTRSQNVGKTADKIVLSSLLDVTSYKVKVTIPLGKPTSAIWSVQIVNSIDGDEAEEREWDSIVHKSHVRQALRRMAIEARQQYYSGETEEGGFGLE